MLHPRPLVINDDPQFLVSWIPFYWLGKCLGLGLLYLPGGNIPTVVFERVVVCGMDYAHHVLNNLVVPNVVEFTVSLPWRVLMVLFPTTPPPTRSSSRSGSHAEKNKTKAGRGGAGEALLKESAGGALLKENEGNKSGFSCRLKHLSTPTKKIDAKTVASSSKTAARNGSLTEGDGQEQLPSLSPLTSSPPFPSPSPSHTPTISASDNATGDGGRVTRSGCVREEGRPAGRRGDAIAAAAANKNDASTLVPQRLDGDENSDTCAVSDPVAVAEATKPVRGDDGARADGDEDGDTSPDESGSGSDRSRRRRSLGELLRSAVTGDSNVRLRDHLFDLSTASPAPPAADNSPARGQRRLRSLSQREPSRSTSSTRGGGSMRALEETPPKKSPVSTLPTLSSEDGSSNSNRRSGGGREARTRYSTRRRPSEFSQPVSRGGGGDGDEAGGGRSSNGYGSTGTSTGTRGTTRSGGVRRRASGGSAVGAGAEAGAGRRILPETKSSTSSKARTVRGGPTASTEPTTGTRGHVGGGGGDASTADAAAVADSRAQRLAEWRKKRAEKTRQDQYGKARGGGGAGGDRSDGKAAGEVGYGRTRRGSDDGAGDGGGGEGSIRSVEVVTTQGKASTSANAAAAAVAVPTAGKSRRFRHVERFRSEVAKTGPGLGPG